MYFIKEFFLILLVAFSIEGRRRFEIRDETRKSLTDKAQRNFDNTVNGLKRLNKLQRRLMRLKNRTETDADDDNTDVLLETPMGNPNLYQGDIILTENQIESIVSDIVKEAEDEKIDVSDLEDKAQILKRKKRAVSANMYYKWTFPIPYYVDSGVNASLITTALNGIASETCIRFSKSATPISGKSGLRYYLGSGCWSYIGRIYSNAPQDISIGNGCAWNGIIQHETAHALGVHHQQARTDRDSFVNIQTANIIPGLESNFVKRTVGSVNEYGVAYDYGSGMHYGRYDFTNNGNPTIASKNTLYDKTMGQYIKLSFNDLKLLNFQYCNSTCATKLSCQNGAYTNPNNCAVCKCPLGFSGTLCQNFATSTSTACGAQQLTATTTTQTLKITGSLDCYYYISTTSNYKIKVNVVSTRLPNYDPCYSGKSLEIKYTKDKTATGINFCGSNTNKAVTSESNSVLIRYVGSSSTDTFTLTYVRA
uniref:Zinc metalloproteinase n=1 Tax=Strongyloides papillosus TaxID=174720 RepID=A0A0N5C6Z0_STREA